MSKPIVVGHAIPIDTAIQDEAQIPLGRVLVNLILEDGQLKFNNVSSTLAKDPTGIMVARTKLIYTRAVQDLEKRKSLTDAEIWRAEGLIRKAKSGDLNFPRNLMTFQKEHGLKGVNQDDPNHHPIVLFSEYEEELDWRIAGYEYKKFTAIVTGDPSVDDRGMGGIKAPPFENIFDNDAFIGSNGSVLSGPARLRKPNYVFFKYHLVLLDAPFATHDPDVICGSPIQP